MRIHYTNKGNLFQTVGRSGRTIPTIAMRIMPITLFVRMSVILTAT